MGKAKKLAAPRPTAQMLNYRAEPLVLIIAPPPRELATQIFDESRRFCYRSMLRPCVVYGGVDIMSQRAELEKGCDVLVTTPGRLLDFLERGHSLSLRRIKFVVVDEADQMLDMGFGPQLQSFFLHGDMSRDDDMQITIFAATYTVVGAHVEISRSWARLNLCDRTLCNLQKTSSVMILSRSESAVSAQLIKILSQMLMNSPYTHLDLCQS